MPSPTAESRAGTAARRVTSALAAAVLVALTTTGCATSAPPPTPGDLLLAYFHSRTVANDLLALPPPGASRELSLAASLSQPQLAGLLAAPYPCGQRLAVLSYVGSPAARDPGCPIPPAVDAAGGSEVRLMLVRHDDGGLEIVPLYKSLSVDLIVTVRARLFDATGTSYVDLADFQRRNTVLSRDDEVLVARDPTLDPTDPRTGGDSTTGYGVPDPPPQEPLVVVPGSTAPRLWLYYGGGAVALGMVVALLMGGVVLLTRRR